MKKKPISNRKSKKLTDAQIVLELKVGILRVIAALSELYIAKEKLAKLVELYK